MAVRVSVVIPTHNKREQLELTLAGFRYQTHGGQNLELIIVDDGSADGTEAWLEGWVRDPSALPVGTTARVIRLPQSLGPGVARNRGAAEASGGLLLFLDADMIPDPDFVHRHAQYHVADPFRVVVVGTVNWLRVFTHLYPGLDEGQRGAFGAVRHLYDPEPPIGPVAAPLRLVDPLMVQGGAVPRLSFRPKFSQHYDAILQEYGEVLNGFSIPWTFCLTGNLSVERGAFAAAGGFDESFVGWGAEDWEWGYRLHRLGLRFRCVHDAIAVHQEHPVDRQRRRLTSRLNTLRFIAKHPVPEVLALVLLFVPPWFGLRQLAQFVTEWQTLEAQGGSEPVLQWLKGLLLRACQRLAQPWIGSPGFVWTLEAPPAAVEATVEPTGPVDALAAAGAPSLGRVAASLLHQERGGAGDAG